MTSVTLKSFEVPASEYVAEHSIAYTEWPNEGRVPVICVHGLTRNGRDFDELASNLVANSRIICPDMAGRGKSAWLENPLHYHYGTYFADLLALLDHCGIERCQWVGTSMGGILGMMMAAMHPERISALVLNDIGMIVAREGLKRISEYAGQAKTFVNRAQAKAWLRDILAPFGIKEERHWQHLFKYGLEQNSDGSIRLGCDPRILEPYRQETEGFTKIQDIDLSQLWAEVRCPTLILRGKESDILRPETFDLMIQKEGSTGITIQEAGHAPGLMADDQIEQVTEWLRRQRSHDLSPHHPVLY